MAASEALSVPAEGIATAADPEAAREAATVPKSSAAPQFRTQIVPIAQLVAIVLGVFAIIWNQQQSIDSLRTELSAEISSLETELRAEIRRVETELRTELSTEIGGLRTELSTEISELRAEVAENGQRLARIEGSLGIGIPDANATASPG